MVYPYAKQVASDRLAEEIRKSAITKALDHITTEGTGSGTLVHIYFKATLDTAEEAELDAIVAAHVPTPMEENRVIKAEVVSSPALGSKVLSDGRKIFKRVSGIQDSLETGINHIVYTIPYAHAKFMAIEFTNTEVNDTVDLEVLDDAQGTISGTPYSKLNQFGFSANMAKDYYKHFSEFDADVYGGMQLKITYTSKSPKQLGINFVMNEVKI